MKYKIEIWRWHNMVAIYESDDIKEVLKWYLENWKDCYDRCGCTYYLYEESRELSFDEMNDLGFYD